MSTKHIQGDSINDYANNRAPMLRHNPPLRYEAGRGSPVIPLFEKSTADLVLEALTFLRHDELDIVMLVCDNPDFHGPNNVVTVSGHWTEYLYKDFTGETLLEALQAAVTAKQKATAHGESK